MTERKGQNNLAFASLLQLGDAKPCVDLLVKTHRAPEAAMFARTYAPSKAPDAVDESYVRETGRYLVLD